MRRAGIVTLLLAALTACSAPAGGSASATDAPVTAAPATTAPARPREVRLDGVDPCSLLTPAQRAQLGLDGEPHLYHDEDPLFGEVDSCTTLGFDPRAVSASIVLSLTKGTEAYTGHPIRATVTPTRVQGFPAVIVASYTLTGFCDVAVDVARGQTLDIGFADGGRKPPIPQDELCRSGVAVAEQAMGSLLAAR